MLNQYFEKLRILKSGYNLEMIQYEYQKILSKEELRNIDGSDKLWISIWIYLIMKFMKRN